MHMRKQKWERRHVEGSINSSTEVRMRNEDIKEDEFKKEKTKGTRKASKLQLLFLFGFFWGGGNFRASPVAYGSFQARG